MKKRTRTTRPFRSASRSGPPWTQRSLGQSGEGVPMMPPPCASASAARTRMAIPGFYTAPRRFHVVTGARKTETGGPGVTASRPIPCLECMMAGRGNPSFLKNQKAKKRAEKATEKRAARQARNAEKAAARAARASGEPLSENQEPEEEPETDAAGAANSPRAQK